MKIKSIKKINYLGDVYNLHIDSPNENLNHNYFANGVCVSNCHHAQARSIKNILHKCKNKKYTFGVSGTFPKEDSFDRFTIESYIGPLVYKLTAFQLINEEKFATPIYIVNTILDYATDAEKKALFDARKLKNSDDVNAGSKLLKQESAFVTNSHLRLRYICDLANKAKFNTLILFNDVSEGQGYGRKIYDWLKENTDKNVYYADGSTDVKVREYYNQQMEADKEGKTVIVGSYGTYSEGLDISNIGVIILSQSFKSDFILRQAIGRGMRRGEGKEKVVMFDIIDDLRWTDHQPDTKDWMKNNYLWRQHQERTRTYKEQRFPVYEQKVDFHQSSQSSEELF